MLYTIYLCQIWYELTSGDATGSTTLIGAAAGGNDKAFTAALNATRNLLLTAAKGTAINLWEDEVRAICVPLRYWDELNMTNASCKLRSDFFVCDGACCTQLWRQRARGLTFVWYAYWRGWWIVYWCNCVCKIQRKTSCFNW